MFKMFNIPHKCWYRYKGSADGGLAGTVHIWKCFWCGKRDIRW
jgi:hypothetical protein